MMRANFLVARTAATIAPTLATAGTSHADGDCDEDRIRCLRATRVPGDVESPLDLNEVKADVSAIKATLPHLATKAEVNGLRSDMSAMERRIIRWIVGTTIAAASMAFAIAKVVH